MNSSLVSVIMPAHNAEQFIGEAIESVINQTYPHWELWVIDDGSTDDTAAVVKNYLQDQRINYVFQENQERCIARNNGFRRSTGSYITFLDADDLWLSHKLERQVAYLDANPGVGMCFTRTQSLLPGGDLFPLLYPVHLQPGQDPFYQLLTCFNFIAVGSELTRRGIFEEVGLFDETMPVCANEDWDLWLRVARRYPIHLIDQVTLLRRHHGGNTPIANELTGGESVLKRVFTDPNLPPQIASKKAEVYARFYYRFSRRYLRLKQRKVAFVQWQRAVRTYPLSILTLDVGRKSSLDFFLSDWLLTNLPRLKQRLLKRGGAL